MADDSRIVNTGLGGQMTLEKLKAMGFTPVNDGSGDPFGTTFDMKIGDFTLTLDPTMVVQMSHKRSEFIYLDVRTADELQSVIHWMRGE